jgi:hypothetical protein
LDDIVKDDSFVGFLVNIYVLYAFYTIVMRRKETDNLLLKILIITEENIYEIKLEERRRMK